MSYATLEKKIKTIPEECLSDVAEYIEYVLFRWERKTSNDKTDLSRFFGSLDLPTDGLSIQREMLDE